ncbi:MAG: phosphotransferase, partial [Chloroflexi bacterium]|nr:phosphotransferase [Chloroflexota bacterium]
GLGVAELAFLPLGADLNTAVYRAESHDRTTCFVKLRRGDFNPASVAVPKFLSDLGLKQIIPPLPTQSGQLWASLPPYNVILYPFVEGRNGFEVDVSDRHRIELGAALKVLHTAVFPPAITNSIRREKFSPQWREKVKSFLARIENETFADPLAAELAAFLRGKGEETAVLINRTGQLAQMLQEQPLEFVLCHADIHGWNLLIDADNTLYIVDWDTLVFAPKERDLMFVGCGLGGNGHTLQEEEALFYQGYEGAGRFVERGHLVRPIAGETPALPIALAYYRYERIIEDIAIYCEQIFVSDDGGADRKQALTNLKSNFWPNGVIEIARQSDKTFGEKI